MKLSDFDYYLPKELIAQYPSQKRDESRLLVLHRDTGKIEHRVFKDIVEYFRKGDLLLLNNTKVVPARLFGRKETGGKVEVLVLYKGQEANSGEFEVLLKPARGCKVGSKLIFGEGELKGEVTRIEDGRRFFRFECNGELDNMLNKFGHIPLPPYIKREDDSRDRERYQTVFASKKGAIASPTAGLHFTKDILSRISGNGVDVEYITLHVGYGTFKPVKDEDITNHQMEDEYFEVEKKVVDSMDRCEGRNIAVGTTTCRALESLGHCEAAGNGNYQGWTDAFIYPPYRFKMVDALLTNFHLSRTTLLMLVSAFCGRELLLSAYREAIKEKYRFYSYGDAMLIL
ncbi:MAG: tRNA preQ1(34) S-adenosylmethionine ribosyltransferase-isomerase QueA [Candidatus Omnitrophota bacterium]|jgi:S-adenosylmethionine:tRNA ribosyltransferase-isomerase|nr:tRNA preQ1(34) S-adenosylmethionine ribosyltransferase-isomerase QueA [Candidatus Omnitrophota bacterium]